MAKDVKAILSNAEQSQKKCVYDGMQAVQERDGEDNVTATNIWDGNIGGLEARIVYDIETPANPPQNYLYHYDGSGNVTAVTDETQQTVAQYEYDAYGNLINSNGAYALLNPWRFSTKYYDDGSGLYYYGYRFYSPGLGKWINRDPIAESGGLNLYGFVGSDPINFGDEYGFGKISLAIRIGKWGKKSIKYLKRSDAKRLYKKEGADIEASKQQIKKWSKKKGSKAVIEKHGDGTLHGHPGGKTRKTSTGNKGGHGFIKHGGSAYLFSQCEEWYMKDFKKFSSWLTAEYWAQGKHPSIQSAAATFDVVSPLSIPSDIGSVYDMGVSAKNYIGVGYSASSW